MTPVTSGNKAFTFWKISAIISLDHGILRLWCLFTATKHFSPNKGKKVHKPFSRKKAWPQAYRTICEWAMNLLSLQECVWDINVTANKKPESTDKHPFEIMRWPLHSQISLTYLNNWEKPEFPGVALWLAAGCTKPWKPRVFFPFHM